jgi:hypothetical protein
MSCLHLEWSGWGGLDVKSYIDAYLAHKDFNLAQVFQALSVPAVTDAESCDDILQQQEEGAGAFIAGEENRMA